MRKAFIAAAVFGAAFASGHAANAAACANGANLGQWLGAGFSCTIGDKTFSNFTYTDSSGGGATPIAASSITITSVNNGSSGIGFEFNAPWSVGIGQSLDSAIGFTVSITAPPPAGVDIVDAELVQAGSSFSGNGIGSVAENLSNNTNLLTVDSAGMVQLSDSSTFSPTGSVNVVKDISVRGNTGTASISLVTDTFSQSAPKVPEPGSLLLLGTGLIGLGFVVRRHR